MELFRNIEQWGKDKGILNKATPLDQFRKTLEEVDELREALEAQSQGLEYFTNSKGVLVNTQEEINDAIGDISVTLTLQAKLQNTTIEECVQGAYNIISKRTGKMINGQFVKDE